MSRQHRQNQSKQVTTKNSYQPKESNNQRVSLIRGESHYFTGPIPPAIELAKYNDVIPDGANRIMLMAEQQAQHRIECEKKVITNDISNSHLGLILGFILQLSLIIGGIIIAIKQSMWEGIAISIAVVILGVINFQITKYQRKRELKLHNKPDNIQQ
jgi:uncharacterized membrane protein